MEVVVGEEFGGRYRSGSSHFTKPKISPKMERSPVKLCGNTTSESNDQYCSCKERR